MRECDIWAYYLQREATNPADYTLCELLSSELSCPETGNVRAIGEWVGIAVMVLDGSHVQAVKCLEKAGITLTWRSVIYPCNYHAEPYRAAELCLTIKTADGECSKLLEEFMTPENSLIRLPGAGYGRQFGNGQDELYLPINHCIGWWVSASL